MSQICRNMYYTLSALLAIAHRMLWVRLSGCRRTVDALLSRNL